MFIGYFSYYQTANNQKGLLGTENRLRPDNWTVFLPPLEIFNFQFSMLQKHTHYSSQLSPTWFRITLLIRDPLTRWSVEL